jgi:hypothetical protein
MEADERPMSAKRVDDGDANKTPGPDAADGESWNEPIEVGRSAGQAGVGLKGKN